MRYLKVCTNGIISYNSLHQDMVYSIPFICRLWIRLDYASYPRIDLCLHTMKALCYINSIYKIA